ncbi:HAD-IC family P-type ATPase [Streptomyces zagrosensis]|uniref:Cation transport ATPase n=1 Tax=Streptomyces zagrosensis TaxID=1042984 RepID=A0A7W9QHA7_9ACTN|nr:HAD-IC family P-type ATPase [Streptomyces zagrosensis]MBB5939658.1 cation transport ATPase [Streptomyces zagrosensis]
MTSQDECAGADTLRLNIADLLPGPPARCEPCVQRIVISLGQSKAVGSVHRAPDRTGGAGTVCVHFDAAALAVEDVHQAARTASDHTRLDHGTSRHGGTDADNAGDAGDPAGGYDDAEDDTPQVADRSPGHGHGHGHVHSHDHSHAHGLGFLGEHAELVFALLSGLAYLTGLLLDLTTEVAEPIPLFCYLAAYAFGGFFTVREAITTIRAGRFEVDFLMLVAAVGAAAIGKWAEGAVLLFLFSLGHALEEYAMGRARRSIEALAELTPKTALLRRDGRSSEVLVEHLVVGDTVVVRPHALVPADGIVRSGKSAVNQAAVTGESMPADKVPVDDVRTALRDPDAVARDSRVFAGTVNGAGALEVTVTSRAQDNTLARVVAMVRDAETRQSPTQAFTARFQRVFVPAVIGTVVALLGAGLVVDEPFSASLYRAMAVLVAASPCALAIATPAAVLSAVGRAARSGVLIKGGGPLEQLGKLTAIAFDKTGTLTEGQPRVTDVLPAPGVPERELLTTALAVERLSDHPLAQAVVRDLAQRLGDASVPTAEELQAIVGRGVLARVHGVPVAIGSTSFFAHVRGPEPRKPEARGPGVRVVCVRAANAKRTEHTTSTGNAGNAAREEGPREAKVPVEPVALKKLKDLKDLKQTERTEETLSAKKAEGIAVAGPPLPAEIRVQAERLECAGRTTMVVRHGGCYLGIIGVMDTPRPEAARVVAQLRALGIRRAVMISGDNQRVADAVADQVGLDDAWGDLLPEGKVAAIERLCADEHRTAMIGDGVNDAPAMASATVGIAMGAAGSAVALETADIALMSDGLSKLPLVTGLSRRTSAVIKQNLLLSLGIVAVLVPATVLGLGIGPAVLVHEGSTLLVVANALRLLGYPEHV